MLIPLINLFFSFNYNFHPVFSKGFTYLFYLHMHTHTYTQSCIYPSHYEQPPELITFASLSPIKNMRLTLLTHFIQHLSSAPYKSHHTLTRAHTLIVVLIHKDLWVRRKASLIIWPTFSGVYIYYIYSAWVFFFFFFPLEGGWWLPHLGNTSHHVFVLLSFSLVRFGVSVPWEIPSTSIWPAHAWHQNQKKSFFYFL